MADKLHKCYFCGKYFTRNTTLIKHLEKNYACKRNIKDGLREDIIKSLRTKASYIVNGLKVYYCKFCNNEFSSKQLKYKHQLTCVEQTRLNNKIAMLNNLAKFIDNSDEKVIMEKIDYLINQPININIDQSINKTINNNNITNNFNNYNFNHINYIYTLGFGKYNIEGYTKKNGKRFKDILSKNMDRDSKDNSYNPGNLIVDIVNDTYFNRNDPTHMSVYMKDASSNQMQVYDGSGIVNYDKNIIIKNMIDHSKSNVERITGYLNISGLVNESQEQYCSDSISNNLEIDSKPIEAKCIENTQYAVNLYHNPEFKGNPINKDNLSQYMTYDRIIK
jgi:hypothetical protein